MAKAALRPHGFFPDSPASMPVSPRTAGSNYGILNLVLSVPHSYRVRLFRG